ncbi:MAG: class I SAM-dependent RNA methyltransferase [Bacilli bacterium]
MNINDEFIVKIDNNDFNGNGICRINNIVTFIFGALKDEVVKIRIININKRYMIGEILEILKPSNDRIIPKCKYYNKCGGCSFLHTTYEKEINIKINEIEKIFNTKVNYLYNKNTYNYRNKVILHVLNGKLGYYSDKTHDLCEIDSCELLDSKINLKIGEIKKYNLLDINEIMIRCINDKIMINIQGNIKDKSIYNIKCDSLYVNDKFIKGEEYLIDEINYLKYTIYPLSFYQVNKEGMINIYNKALDYAHKGNNLLDLYCGTGTIGIYMHNNFKNVVGVEINESSIKNANINKELNNLNNIEFFIGDASIINKHIDKFDCIVVDPPRSGLSKKVSTILNNSKSNRIVYISCNHKTLKRDIDLLTNYSLIDISVCSMFPRTKHIECISLLERMHN